MKASRKQILVKWLRNNNLLWLADCFRFLADSVRNYKVNRKLQRSLPGFVFPPPTLAYDAYSSVNYPYYFNSGSKAAGSIYKMLEPYLTNDKNLICEWGCGPARIIRHMPKIPSAGQNMFIGTDYNNKTISWCEKNIAEVKFVLNGLNPPFSFPDNYLDCVYCVSVFTHLSGDLHFSWLREILRVLRPGGIFLMTANGDNIRKTQLNDEGRLYDSGQLVVRGKVKEGSRIFLAFHSPVFMRQTFLKGLDILKHDTNPDNYISSGQDVWIVRKPY